MIRAGASGVVIRQVKKDEGRQFELIALVRFACFHKCSEFVKELVGTKLVGIVGLEIGIKRIEVITQDGLRRLYATEQRNRPRPGTVATVRFADVWGQSSSLLDICARAGCFLTGRSALLRTCGLKVLIAPECVDEFSVVAEAEVIARQVVPEKSGARIVNVRHVVVERKFVRDLPLKVIGTLFTAIGNRPHFLVVVGGDGSGGPDVAVAGDFPTIIKIVEHAKLQGEFVFIRSDVFAVKG